MLRQLIKYIFEWEDFIDSIEKGYTYTIYDYTNDLSLRDLIQTFTEDFGRKNILYSFIIKLFINPKIKKLDNRFIYLTREIDKPLLNSQEQQEEPWWYYRIPKKLIGELAKDFKKHDVI